MLSRDIGLGLFSAGSRTAECGLNAWELSSRSYFSAVETFVWEVFVRRESCDVNMNWIPGHFYLLGYASEPNCEDSGRLTHVNGPMCSALAENFLECVGLLGHTGERTTDGLPMREGS